MLPHDFDHSDRGRQKNLDILTSEFRAILERPPFLPECQQISRRLLVRQPGRSCNGIHYFMQQSFAELMNIVQ